MMNDRARRMVVALIIIVLIQAACNFPRAETPEPASTLNALYTQAAYTLQAMATQAALTPTASPILASPTALATSTPLPTFTASPFRTNTPVSRCDWAQFVSDVSYPDGSVVGRNQPFTKIWRLKNIGTCTWTTAYALVFVSGDRMGAPLSVPLPSSVPPGQTVDVAVNLVSPELDGQYRGYFKLRNASGVLFGVGNQASGAFWVDVRVVGETFVAYDFVERVCEASWDNGQEVLPCPGSDGDPKGFVYAVDTPLLENGTPAGQRGLFVVPRQVNNGFVRGTYPPIRIRQGDRFQARVHCRYNSIGCNVVFRLDYQVGDGPLRNLGQWNEAYEGKWYTLNIDLSALANKDVRFFLIVHANGSPNNDFALWIGPRIVRMGTPTPAPTPTSSRTPTPTPTFTSTPTITSTPIPSPTPTPTFTPTPSDTPSPTLTPTFTPTPSDTPSPTPTPTFTPTP